MLSYMILIKKKKKTLQFQLFFFKSETLKKQITKSSFLNAKSRQAKYTLQIRKMSKYVSP